MVQIPEVILQLVVGIGIALVTSLITVHLSLKQFRSERWWERKEQAYSTILEALYKMRSYYDAKLDDGTGEAQLPKNRSVDLWAQHTKGREDVDRAVAVGEFVICGDVVTILKGLLRSLEVNHEDSVEDCRVRLAAIDDCCAQVREHAKRDLELPTRKSWHWRVMRHGS